ncbi:MAG: rhomboid family intramembrane serine protease [Capnocytophaga sp.]|nr:rhomboid family intramembrane serine protease [Capnocytophaga sp.]
MNITRAVKHLIIANVIFFIIALIIPDFKSQTALYYFENPQFHWWQIFSHMFMHGSEMHILFNMFALYSFGSPLESYFGSNRFFLFYFACGLGAATLHTAVNYYEFHHYVNILLEKGYTYEQITEVVNKGQIFTNWKEILSDEDINNLFSAYFTPAVGASGAIYGILVAFGMLFPNAELMLIFLPIPIKAKYFIPVLILLDLFSGVTGFSIFGQNIAHFAHIGGAIIGFILMWIWRKNSFNDRRIY